MAPTRSYNQTHRIIASATVDGVLWYCAAAVRLSPFRGGEPIVTDLAGFERYDADGEVVERCDELDPLTRGDVIEALSADACARYLEETEPGDSREDLLADHLEEQRKEALLEKAFDHQRDLRRDLELN